jgi:large subunit ribosomal protein L37Ae
MVKTKKVGLTGRFGTRYGRGVKVAFEKIERKQKTTYVCPSCKKTSVERVSTGIWQCKKCNAKFTGGAYSPTTELSESE